MNSVIRSLLVIACAGVVTALPASAAVESGQPAPDFTLADVNGQQHSLSQYRGKTVVLEWHNPECPVVGKHYESDNIPKLQREATAEGVVWLTINSGAPGNQGADYSAAQMRSWLDEHKAKPTVYLHDRDGKVGKRYGAKTTPHLYIVDPKGTLVYQGAIDSISSGSKSDIPKATNYVRTALAALKDGKPVEPAITKPYGCAVKY